MKKAKAKAQRRRRSVPPDLNIDNAKGDPTELYREALRKIAKNGGYLNRKERRLLKGEGDAEHR